MRNIVSAAASAGLFACALASCAKPAPLPSESAARAAMFGMTPRQVAACMGKPGTRFTENGVTAWSYDSPGGRGRYIPIVEADPSNVQFNYSPFDGGPNSSEFDPEPAQFNQDLSSPPEAACTVQVVFDNGRVGAVSYRARKHENRLYAQQCEAITAACLR